MSFPNQTQYHSLFRCVRPQIASVLHVFSSVEEPNLLAHPGKYQNYQKHQNKLTKTTKTNKKLPKDYQKTPSSSHLLLFGHMLRPLPDLKTWRNRRQQNHTKTKPRPHLHIWHARYFISRFKHN